MDLLRICREGAPHLPVDECPTQDGGNTFEICAPWRDLLFVVPDSGSPVYFTAREEDGDRKAGIVLDEAGAASLVRWVADGFCRFSTEGVLLG